MENIKTLSELADIINACDDYPNAIVDAAIMENGWKDEQEKNIWHLLQRYRGARIQRRTRKRARNRE